MNKPE